MTKVFELATSTLLAGIAAVAAARLRNLSTAQTVLAVPLGVAVFLVNEAFGWTPLPPVSSEDGAL